MDKIMQHICVQSHQKLHRTSLCKQVVADYVAMTPDGRVFDSSLDKGRPYDIRVGSGQAS